MRFSGEIGIKSEWTRRSYEKLLAKNIGNSLKQYGLAPDAIVNRRGRMYVKTLNAQQTASKLSRIFGISSVSPAVQTSSEKKNILQTSVELASATIKEKNTFAVRCNRVGTHEYLSMDICRDVGEQILTSLKERSLRVDLTNPKFTLGVEVRDNEGYVYVETLPGAGGFPVGSQAKVVCLLSGGIDSPVACWLAMKRGCPITPIYLDNTPFTDENSQTKALDAAKKLFEWSIGFPRRVYIVPHGKNLQTFVNEAPRKYTCILCKRMMYRIAERIADIEDAEGVVTGEAIGEQASQTISNLRVLDEAAERYPVHRPLLGFDKTETERLARKIGTFAVSTRKARGCAAAPVQPATRAKLEKVKEAEANFCVESMVEESVKAAKIMTV